MKLNTQISPSPRSYKASQRVIQQRKTDVDTETCTHSKTYRGENVAKTIATNYKCKLHKIITSIRISFL